MKKKILQIKLLALILFLSGISLVYAQKPVKQKDIDLIRYMPNLPFPYKMKDWKAIAAKQDKLLFDFEAKGIGLPLIWWDDDQVNFPIRSFGIPSYVGSKQQEKKKSGL